MALLIAGKRISGKKPGLQYFANILLNFVKDGGV